MFLCSNFISVANPNCFDNILKLLVWSSNRPNQKVFCKLLTAFFIKFVVFKSRTSLWWIDKSSDFFTQFSGCKPAIHSTPPCPSCQMLLVSRKIKCAFVKHNIFQFTRFLNSLKFKLPRTVSVSWMYSSIVWFMIGEFWNTSSVFAWWKFEIIRSIGSLKSVTTLGLFWSLYLKSIHEWSKWLDPRYFIPSLSMIGFMVRSKLVPPHLTMWRKTKSLCEDTRFTADWTTMKIYKDFITKIQACVCRVRAPRWHTPGGCPLHLRNRNFYT